MDSLNRCTKQSGRVLQQIQIEDKFWDQEWPESFASICKATMIVANFKGGSYSQQCWSRCCSLKHCNMVAPVLLWLPAPPAFAAFIVSLLSVPMLSGHTWFLNFYLPICCQVSLHARRRLLRIQKHDHPTIRLGSDLGIPGKLGCQMNLLFCEEYKLIHQYNLFVYCTVTDIWFPFFELGVNCLVQLGNYRLDYLMLDSTHHSLDLDMM